jgi:hypothetical protein
MDIKLTDYQIAKLIELGNERNNVDQRLKELTSVILDANGSDPNQNVTFNIDKKVLTLEDKKK